VSNVRKQVAVVTNRFPDDVEARIEREYLAPHHGDLTDSYCIYEETSLSLLS